MKVLSATEARANFSKVLDAVHDDREPAVITRPGGRTAVIIDGEEWDAIAETLYLLASPANASHLAASIAEARAGKAKAHELVDDAQC